MSDATSPNLADDERLVVGAMSGTSADGVDAAAVAIRGRGLEMQARYLGHVEHGFDADLKRRIFAIRESGKVELAELATVGRLITLAYAEAVGELFKKLQIDAKQVAAIAAHGQTLYHAPPETIQWFDPSLLAARTGCVVVSDFRRADCAAGGQGAPLVPFADWILFRHPEKTRVILNLGGIANLTYLPAGRGIDDIIAFDTGPGNCVLDHLMREADGKDDHDSGGRYSAGGQVIESVEKTLRPGNVETWLSWHHFLAEPPPKSTDVADMMRAWSEVLHAARPFEPSGSYLLNDLLRSAIFMAVHGVVTALRSHCRLKENEPGELVIGGGGTRNDTLIADLTKAISSQGRATGWHHRDHPLSPESGTFARVWVQDWRLAEMSHFGLPSQAREAVCFAILGAATLDNEPANVPSATGAARRVVLGSITPTPSA